MILDEATFEAFGYYPSELTYGSTKLILVICTLCGKIRVVQKRRYHTFCNSCSQVLSEKSKGKNNPNYHGGKIKCFCLTCGFKIKVAPGRLSEGRGKYCCDKCYRKARKGKSPTEKTKIKLRAAQKGEKNGNYGNHLSEKAKARISVANYRCGKKESERRHQAKRRRLGSVCLIPLKEGEVGHHPTDEYIIGIQKEAHVKCNGTREGHRTLVLEWLKENDKKKYNLVLSALVKGPLK